VYPQIEFLVIGAQKCATTWLFDCLKEHPQIQLPGKKREVEYLGGDLYQRYGADWYFSLLGPANPHKKTGDVSVEYIYDARSAEIVHHHIPKVKMILSLREPIDRAISAYYWHMRKKAIPDLSLEEALARALHIFEQEGLESTNTLVDILKRGFYDLQLLHYLNFFPIDQFKFVLYDDIGQFPEQVLEGIYHYCGVHSAFTPSSIKAKPKRNTYLEPLIGLQRRFSDSKFINKSLDLTNQLLANIGAKNQKPKLSSALESDLKQLFVPHNQQLCNLVKQAPKHQQPLSIGSSPWLNLH
jgi:hypothetical protein